MKQGVHVLRHALLMVDAKMVKYAVPMDVDISAWHQVRYEKDGKYPHSLSTYCIYEHRDWFSFFMFQCCHDFVVGNCSSLTVVKADGDCCSSKKCCLKTCGQTCQQHIFFLQYKHIDKTSIACVCFCFSDFSSQCLYVQSSFNAYMFNFLLKAFCYVCILLTKKSECHPSNIIQSELQRYIWV